MAVAKLLLFVVGLLAQEYGATPPNIRPPVEQLRQQRGVENLLPWILAFARTLLWSWNLFEASVLVALSGYCPAWLVPHLLRFLPSSITDPTPFAVPTPAYVAGTFLMFAGATLRAVCYRTLGLHFTFELSIRPKHTLVTGGVYSVVRHPSYTGIVGLAVGGLLCVLDPRGLVVSVFTAFVFGTESHEGVTAVLACVWAAALGSLYVGISGRIDREDAMLESNFGEEWRAWARKVPYRLVPGVY